MGYKAFLVASDKMFNKKFKTTVFSFGNVKFFSCMILKMWCLLEMLTRSIHFSQRAFERAWCMIGAMGVIRSYKDQATFEFFT